MHRLRVDIAKRFEHSIIVSTFTPQCSGRDFWEESEEQILMLREMVGSDYLVFGGGDPTFAIPGSDMDSFVTNLYENPQEIMDEAQKKVDECLIQFERLRKAGAEGFV